MSKPPTQGRDAGRRPRSARAPSPRWPRVGLQIAAGVVLAVTSFRVARVELPTTSAALIAGALTGIFTVWMVLRYWWVPTSRLPTVQVGEIWWALVPFEEGKGSKDRPALVVATRKRSATVLMFTSADKEGRPGFLAVDPHLWRTPRTSYLRTDREITVPLSSMRRRERPRDARLMEQLARSRS